MKKVLVIGCPGAGKSTFSRGLRAKTGLPLYYLDMLWHKPDKSHFTQEEFDCALSEILKSEEWIVAGNSIRTPEERLRRCDTVFLLNIPVNECLQGVKARVGVRREDMPWTETGSDPEFEQWIVDFPRDQMPKIREVLTKDGDGRRVVEFRSRAEADEFLKNL
mgnify:FL=1